MRSIGKKVILKLEKENKHSVIKIKQPSFSYVVVYAPSIEEIGCEIEVGSKVILPKYIGKSFKYLDDELLVVDFRDLLLNV